MRHRSVTSTRRRLGGTALGLGGVAFGLIQILQGTIGAFDPRPVVSLLIAVTIGFAGLALERGRHVAARGRVLRGLLRVWPLQRITDTDPLVLGVFPPADAVRGSRLGPYVARDADAAAARTIALPAAASASEADRARELLPDIDVAAGDRLAVALSGSREASRRQG